MRWVSHAALSEVATQMGMDPQELRRIVEFSGIRVGHEKAGTWWIITEGVYINRYAYVDARGQLLVFSDVGDLDILDPDHWPRQMIRIKPKVHGEGNPPEDSGSTRRQRKDRSK